MQEFKSIQNLSEQIHCFVAVQSPVRLLAHVLQEIPLVAVFHGYKQIQRILEEFVYFDNIRIGFVCVIVESLHQKDEIIQIIDLIHVDHLDRIVLLVLASLEH